MRNSVSNRKFLSVDSINGFAANWVHPSVAAESREFWEHSKFIIWHVLIGCSAFFVVPAFLVYSHTFGLIEISILVAFGLPVLWAYIVSATGRLDLGIIATLTTYTMLITGVCMVSGGLGSPALALLCVVPLESAGRLGGKSLGFGFALLSASAVVLGFAQYSLDIVPTLTLLQVQGVVTIALLAYAFSLATRHGMFRERTDDDFADEQAQNKLVSDNVSDMVSRHDSTGNVKFVSGSARKLFGVLPSKLRDNGMFQKIHVQDRITFLSQISAVSNEGCVQTSQLRIRCKGDAENDWKWVEMVSHPYPDTSCGETDVVCVTRDVTKVKEQELQIDRTAEQVKESDEAQRRFLATMSHEWRTPLNAILGFSDILQQELFGKLPYERHLEYVNLIHESGQHLLNLVNDLLNMSRIECDKYELLLEPFPFSEAVDVTVNMLQQSADRNNICLKQNVSETLPDITADRRSCQQILINLVSNAIKFSEANGIVAVRVEQKGSDLLLEVSDNGIGMDDEFLSKIGTPFMQADSGTDRKYEGTGLGLSVVKGLIELHKGSFEVQSMLGEGTTVSVTLPLDVQDNRLVPADTKKNLVHLNERSTSPSRLENETNITSRRGDSRARVSA